MSLGRQERFSMSVTIIVDKNKEIIIPNGAFINAHEQGQVLFVYDKDEKIISIFKEWVCAIVESGENVQT